MQTTSWVLATYLANAVWSTFLVTLIALGLMPILRRGPAAHRHALWIAAIVLSFLVPVVATLNAFRVSRVATVVAGAENTELTEPSALSTKDPTLWQRMRHASGRNSVPLAPIIAEVVAALYVAFLLYRAICLCWGWRRLLRIASRASAVRFSPLQAQVAQRCLADLEGKRILIRTSDEVQGPVAIGIRRQMVLLPEWFVANSSEHELACALSHEFAHLRRHDFLLNVICEWLLLPLSFHPAASLLRAKVEQSREMACDEIAGENLRNPRGYARSLVGIAQSIGAAARQHYALGLFDSNSMEERIMAILKPGEKRGRTRAIVASVVLAACCVGASAFSVQVAQTLSAKPADFAGTWEGKFEGKTFITLKLAAKDGKVGGTVSRISIRLSPGGTLTQASAIEGQDEMREASPEGNVLHLVIPEKGVIGSRTGQHEESIQYDMKLIGSAEAELRIAGIPPDAPAPVPWKLERSTKP